MVVHGGPPAHRLIEEVQNIPDTAVQYPFSPHKQGAVFGVAPSVCVQSGAATHRQNLDHLEEHGSVDMESVLKLRRFLFILSI